MTLRTTRRPSPSSETPCPATAAVPARPIPARDRVRGSAESFETSRSWSARTASRRTTGSPTSTAAAVAARRCCCGPWARPGAANAGGAKQRSRPAGRATARWPRTSRRRYGGASSAEPARAGAVSWPGGPIAQLARAPRLQRGCRQFESVWDHHKGPGQWLSHESAWQRRAGAADGDDQVCRSTCVLWIATRCS